MRMDGLEQITLTVADVQATVRFYTQVLGLLASTIGSGGTTLHAGNQTILIHPQGETGVQPRSGPATLSFGTHAPMTIITGHLAARGVSIVAGPGPRADGRASVFIHDPDGHLVEMISTTDGRQDQAPESP